MTDDSCQMIVKLKLLRNIDGRYHLIDDSISLTCSSDNCQLTSIIFSKAQAALTSSHFPASDIEVGHADDFAFPARIQ